MDKSEKKFERPIINTKELALYTQNPYETYINGLYYFRGGNSSDIVIRPADDILIKNGGAGALHVYPRLLNDSTVQAGFSKVLQEITSRDLVVSPARDTTGDKYIAEFVKKVLTDGDLNLDEVYRALAESYITGIRVGELLWKKGKHRTPMGFKPKDSRRFRFVEKQDGTMNLNLIKSADELDLIPLPPRKFICQRYWTVHNGDPYGSGLGRVLYNLVKFKRRAIESELLYSDRFSTPTAVCHAPSSATVNEVNEIYNRLSNLSQEVAMVLPDGYKLDFVDPGGKPDIFVGIRDYLTQEITLLIAGESEAGNPESGSRASSEVANTVRIVKAKELSELISYTLNRTLVRWIVDLNFGSNVRSPSIKRDFRMDEESTLTVTDIVAMKEKLALEPTKEWMANHFRVEFSEEETARAPGEPAEPVSEFEGKTVDELVGLL